MQNTAPSDCARTSPTGRRIAFGVCLAIVVAIASIATNRTAPLRTTAAAGSQLSSATGAPGAGALALPDAVDEGRAEATSASRQTQRFARRAAVFDSEARAEFRENVRESLQLSVARLGDELEMASAED